MSGTSGENHPAHASGLPRPLAGLFVFFSSWRFPVLTLAVMFSFDLFQLLMLVIPRSDSGFGAFAEEFRIWCYGLDQASGKLEVGYVAMFLAQPIVICGALFFVWYRQIVDAFKHQTRATLPYLAAALALVSIVCVSLVGVGSRSKSADLPFPAAALRTSHAPPALALVDQNGVRTDLSELRGRVVVITGIYATCYHTCPLIMSELKRTLDALRPEERASVSVLALTLNPEHDTQAVMAETAKRYAVSAPEFRLLSGPPAEIDATLDRLEIARSKNPMTGNIDHANLFILVDRQGQVAYRLTLGERQERWLADALRLLVREAAVNGV